MHGGICEMGLLALESVLEIIGMDDAQISI